MKSDSKKEATQMRMVATGLLASMALLFVGLEAMPWRGGLAGFVRAFAEAAMVGALADWFAVVALFRHPLGLPIPHTAVIPRNKRRIGRSLAAFVVENFLTRAVLDKRIAGLDFVQVSADWLLSNQARIAELGAGLFARVLPTLNDQPVKDALRRFARERLNQIELAPLAGNALSILTEGQRHEQLLAEVLGLTEHLVLENREFLRKQIRDELPLPDELPWVGAPLGAVKDWVAEYAARKAVEKIIATLHDAGSDPQHDLRRLFRDKLGHLIEALKTSPEMKAKGEKLKQDLLDHRELQQYIGDVWDELKRLLLADLAGPDSTIRRHLASAVGGLAAVVREDRALADRLNASCRETVLDFADQNRDSVRTHIEETVEGWQFEEISRKLESEVGRDLQFVRLNGTIVGGLVGLLIHSVTLLF